MRDPRSPVRWWSGAAVVRGLIAGGVWAQPPQPPTPATPHACQRSGFFHRWSIIRPTRSMTS